MEVMIDQQRTPDANISSSNKILTREALEAQIAEWLHFYLGELLDIPPENRDGSTTFERYGLDSSAAVGMTGDLAEWLGYEVDAAATFDHPSIDKLSHALAKDDDLWL